MANRIQTSIRLSPHGKALIAALSDGLGISRAAVLELALRRLARAEDIVIAPKPKRSHHKAKINPVVEQPIEYAVKPE